MRNIKLEIEYDGTNYRGWQIQSGSQKRTIQETLEKALQKILQEKIRLIGAGRTDAGVHAKGQVANFKTHSEIPLDKLHKGVNALLAQDIAVSAMRQAPQDFHSRFNAKSKVYRYTILNGPQRSAILRNQVYFCRYPLDIKFMQQEAKILLGKHNFAAFCASAGKARNPRRTIKKLKITKQGDLIYVDIEADGFLYNMVRAIAGTLIEIGRGRFPRHRLKSILFSKNRNLAGITAPAKGLCLLKVKY